ncbi:unnamed protein product [Strongylus vulgaris]|uniref:7TM GPCR serpentine receptor class x (Srx) domain-containing protein n=1 Tax=Strongylus vulgaris TaxID=40348 RepID=A0A3P7L2A1_STRVU|nr:unnamed protein product [Strongylus vulgaris]
MADYDNIDNVEAGVIITALGIVGCSSNFIAIFHMFGNVAYQNAFGYICTSHTVASFAACVIFIFWTGPATFL